jgi:hypothetical protein
VLAGFYFGGIEVKIELMKKKEKLLTASRLRQVLKYDEDTGLFTWLVSTSNRVKVGDTAGALNGDGYVLIQIDGKAYKASRLAFLYMIGRFPDPEADHENLNRSDDRWKNLREATRQQNNRNKPVRKDSTTGAKGVSLRECGRFQAYIIIGGKQKPWTPHRPRNAKAARSAAERKYYGDFAYDPSKDHRNTTPANDNHATEQLAA